jgi:hypothetical protein
MSIQTAMVTAYNDANFQYEVNKILSELEKIERDFIDIKFSTSVIPVEHERGNSVYTKDCIKYSALIIFKT